MANIEAHEYLEGKDEAARMQVARRVGERLSVDDLPDAERRAAEALARHLVNDAMERVRKALSQAVKHADYLPRDVARRIAHDVDSIACPFLEVTEVFSDDDWQRLILTISRGARIAAARRASMSEGLALALAQFGDSVVAETLVENPAAPMTSPICHILIERFERSTWVLDKLAERNGLHLEIIAKLIEKVSTAARAKLEASYNDPPRTDPVVDEAALEAMVRLVHDMDSSSALGFAHRLRREGTLTHALLLKVLWDGSLEFFEAAVSVLSMVRLEQVSSVIRHGGTGPVTRLLGKAGIPKAMFDAFWEALEQARNHN